MKKIMISIIIIGMLMCTTLVNVSGEEAIENNDLIYSTDEMLNNEIIKSKYLEKIENPLDDGSLELPHYVPGELIVKFKQDAKINLQSIKGSMFTSIKSIDDLNSKYGGLKSAKKVFKNSLVSSLSNVYKFSFSSSVDISSIIKDYSSKSSIVYAEPNYIYTTSGLPQQIPQMNPIPNDPLFNQQWALSKIHATSGWVIEKGSPDVTIAIVDTGVDYNHPDLAANIWHDPINGNPGYDFVDINTTEYIEYGFVLCPDEDYTVPDSDPMDVFCHGTHCAGIASAVTNNSIGIAGVCWNCKIMPVKAGFKIFVPGWSGWVETALLEYDDVANAIVYAADNGADVISMSYGGYFSSNLEKDVLNYAYSKDVVLIAAAGNDNTYLESYPASYDNVIAVAATDSNDYRAGFSNYGSWVDVAAPGVDILSTIPNGAYDSFSGTSMACPHVAGLAGLILSKNQNTPYPAQMVQSMIPYTTDIIDTDQYIGTGRISAYKALAQKPFAALLDSIPNWEDVKGTIDVKGAAWGENFQYFVLEDGLGENPSSWTRLKTSSTPQGGVLLSLNTKLLAEGLHTIRLKVVCNHGSYTDEILIYVNNQADGSYNADIFVSNCFDSSTPGWGDTHFNKIQDGIDHTRYGNTIFVYDGIYNENVNCTIKSLTLIGQNNDWTIINGSVIIKLARHVTVTGFNIRGYNVSINQALGMYIGSSVILEASKYCTITQNKIKMTEIMEGYQSILLFLSSHNTISDNTIEGLADPIYNWFLTFGIVTVGSSHNTISNNIMRNFQKHIFTGGATDNDIKNNNFKWGQYGIMIAFGIRYTISNNYIMIYEALDLAVANLCKVVENELIGDMFDGCYSIRFIYLEGNSNFNKIVANEINNDGVGIRIEVAQFNNNEIYYNNFIGCIGKDHSGENSTNKWYKEKLLGDDKGNYWSEYEEWHRDMYGTEAKDNNNDGVWDDPMKIMGYGWFDSTKEDKYPVVEPFDIENINVNSEMTVELTSEESQYLTQLEETINNQILAGEYNIVNLEMLTESTTYGSQPSNQPGNTMQSTTGSTTSK